MNIKIIVFLYCFFSIGIAFAEHISESDTPSISPEQRAAIKEEIRKEIEKEQLEAKERAEKETKEQAEKEAKERAEKEAKKQVRQLVYYIIIIIVLIFLILFIGVHWGRKIRPSADADFDTLVIDLVIDLLKRKLQNPPNDLKQQIADVIQHKVLPDALLRFFSRAEYRVQKIDTNPTFVLLTVNVLYIASQSDVVKLTADCSVSWDDLPTKIRSDFIQSRKTEQTYLIYQQGDL
ncbi:MAG: hypothetical protein LBJ67_06700 [Planctomycetaceae bacterium]|jgi:hypothetical protein|nr:hypothetical protein [Planctomycetaceae bacterium]